MSHFMKVQTKINDLIALHAAANELGLGFEERVPARGFYGVGQLCDAVLKLKGRYDVGFNKQEDGNYDMICDWWGGDVAKEIGQHGDKLMQSYAYNKVAIEAGRRGYTVQKSMEKDGKLKVRVGGFN